MTSHRGRHYTVENARLYTLPETLPPIYVAAGGPKAAELAARLGDGLIGDRPRNASSSRPSATAGGERAAHTAR